MPSIAMNVDGEQFALSVGSERKFKSGSKGFWANGKIRIDGKDYNVSFPLVEIGSKPKK